jgi:hypothetical protein
MSGCPKRLPRTRRRHPVSCYTLCRSRMRDLLSQQIDLDLADPLFRRGSVLDRRSDLDRSAMRLLACR